MPGFGHSDGTHHESGLAYEYDKMEKLRQWNDPFPKVQANYDHDVPYIAGPSKDSKTVYIDKGVPKTAKLEDGSQFPTDIPLKIHEIEEQAAFKKLKEQGMNDKDAFQWAHHAVAERAEDDWYRAHDIDVDQANKFWLKHDKRTEYENA